MNREASLPTALSLLTGTYIPVTPTAQLLVQLFGVVLLTSMICTKAMTVLHHLCSPPR
jgi:hypothetical protein